jgi:group I intron endonuclease
MSYKNKISGIYCIRNIINGKRYIGSSKDIVGYRWPKHKGELKNKNHHSKHLENAWYKYGEVNFVFEIIEECEPIKEKLIEREQFWLDTVRIKNFDGTLGEIDIKLSYNISPTAGSPLGVKHTKETKAKISMAGKKRFSNKENHPMFGKHLSEETKKKLSDSIKGKTKGEKHYLFGKHPSEEARKKMSLAASGENNAMYGKYGEDHPAYGNHHTEETKRAISLSQNGDKGNNAKLTWEEVREIRKRYNEGGISQYQLADEYGVGQMTICRIILNRSWKEFTNFDFSDTLKVIK